MTRHQEPPDEPSNEIEILQSGESLCGLSPGSRVRGASELGPEPCPADDDPAVLRVVEFTLPSWTRDYVQTYRQRVREAEARLGRRSPAFPPGNPPITIQPAPVLEERIPIREHLLQTESALQHERSLSSKLAAGLIAGFLIALVALLRQHLDFGAPPTSATSPVSNALTVPAAERVREIREHHEDEAVAGSKPGLELSRPGSPTQVAVPSASAGVPERMASATTSVSPPVAPKKSGATTQSKRRRLFRDEVPLAEMR